MRGDQLRRHAARRARCGGDGRGAALSASRRSKSADAALDRRVADRVHADLEPGRVGGAHAREDLVLVERQIAALARAVRERLAHAGGAAAEGAVGEDLEAADAAAGGGIVQRRRARRDRGVDAAPDEDRVGREGQPRRAAAACASDSRRPAAPPGPSSSVCRITPAEVMPQRREAARSVRARGLAQALERRATARRRAGAARRSRSTGPAGAPSASRSMRPPARIGRARVDARRGERAAVADGAVAVVLQHHDRAIGARRVELGARRQAPLGEVVVLELEADQPLARAARAPPRARSTSCSAAMLRTPRRSAFMSK